MGGPGSLGEADGLSLGLRLGEWDGDCDGDWLGEIETLAEGL